MADLTPKTISEFPSAGTLDGTELFAISQSSATKKAALKDIKNYSLGGVADKISSGDDLDDYIYPGYYAVSTNAIGASLQNAPVGSTKAGILKVIDAIGSGAAPTTTYYYSLQEYTDYTGASYRRAGSTGSTGTMTWGAWAEL